MTSSSRNTVIRVRCETGLYAYVGRPDLLGDCIDLRANAHRFTTAEATGWIAARDRDRFLRSEDWIAEPVEPGPEQGDLFAGRS